MPLEKGASKKAVAKNIEIEQKAGKPHDQAVAIALHTADEAKKHKYERRADGSYRRAD